jgi:coenzyme PQQ precursor peptide PqqA
MEWTTPKFEEICLNGEINCYANAELQLADAD